VANIVGAGGSILVEKGSIQLDYFNSMFSRNLLAQLASVENSEVRSRVASSILEAAAYNKIRVLEILEVPEDVRSRVVGEIKGLISMLKGTVLSRLMGVEARITKLYFEALRYVIPVEYGFKARTRRPPKDYFSAALSYGNMLLYRHVLKEILRFGLDPRLSYLHTPYRHRPSLALDIAEEFRQAVVDLAVIPLYTSRSMSIKGDFQVFGSSIYLNKRGNFKVRRSFQHRMNLKVEGRSLADAIRGQIRKLLEFIHGDRSEYTPFRIQ